MPIVGTNISTQIPLHGFIPSELPRTIILPIKELTRSKTAVTSNIRLRKWKENKPHTSRQKTLLRLF